MLGGKVREGVGVVFEDESVYGGGDRNGPEVKRGEIPIAFGN